MYIPIVSPLMDLWVEFLLQGLLTITHICILFACLHHVGVLQKAIVRFAEWRFSKVILNGVPVSISKLEVDVFTNKVWVTDVIVHSPDRDKWKWDSPVIARFGKVYIHCSFLSLLDPIAGLVGYKWRDFYAISVSDVQVFVEKRRNVYNFHLMDDSLDIPDPAEIMKGLGYETPPATAPPPATAAAAPATPLYHKIIHASPAAAAATPTTSPQLVVANKSSSPTSGTGGSPSKRLESIVSGDASSTEGGGERDLTKSSSAMAAGGGIMDRSLPTAATATTISASASSSHLQPKNTNAAAADVVVDDVGGGGGSFSTFPPNAHHHHHNDHNIDDDDDEAAAAKRANEIVTSMLKTVSKLGKAANEGGKEGLERAFKYQRDGFVHKLKQFQANVGKTDSVGEAFANTAGFSKVEGSRGTTTTMTTSPNAADHLLHRNTTESYIGGSSVGAAGGGGAASAGVGGKKNGPTATHHHPPPPTKASDHRKRSMELMAKESLKVVKQMTKAVEKNVYEIQESFKMPEKKKDYIPEDEMLRIGYIVFRDSRIFTRDVILSSGGGGAIGSPSRRRTRQQQQQPTQQQVPPPPHVSPHSSNTVQPSSTTTTNQNPSEKWSKPIYLKEVAFAGSELCSNASLRDEDGMPLIGVSSLKLIDIMTRRAITEMAKTNTGRLLNNAFGEVLNWMDGKGNSANKP